MKNKVVIVYLVWSDEPQKYLERALLGVARQTYDRQATHLLVIYNSHRPDEQSAIGFVNEQVKKMGLDLPPTTVLNQKNNLGFAGGNNLGMRWAIDQGFDYVFLHNADGYLHPEAVAEMVAAIGTDEKIGQIQPLILLHPEQNLVNTAGNAWHYLGIGYCSSFRQPTSQLSFLPVSEIGYVSGAATLLRVDLLAKYGLWDEEFFLYHEDTDYSLRLKLYGYRVALAARAVFYHQYDFSKPMKYYWLERNRHALKLLFYRWPTLLLLLPLEIAYNFSLILLAVKQNWLDQLRSVYLYWLKPINWRHWLERRRLYQRERIISDRQLLSQTAKTIDISNQAVSGSARAIANPIFTIYYFLLKLAVHW